MNIVKHKYGIRDQHNTIYQYIAMILFFKYYSIHNISLQSLSINCMTAYYNTIMQVVYHIKLRMEV